MPNPVANLLDTFRYLQREIRASIRIYAGKADMLDAERRRVTAFLESFNQVNSDIL
jgi:hypothetical protein